MKNSLTLRSVLTLLALSCSLSLTASAADRSALPGGFVLLNRVAARVHANGDSIVVGDGRINVQLRLGAPTRVLPDGSWLYSHYRATASDGREFAGNLVVRFEKSLVTALVLADRATVTAMIERRPDPSTRQLAANQR